MICCSNCGMKIPGEDRCDLAVVKKTIEGKEYVFCCSRCAEEVESK
ncbi:MAG: transcriptional regulator [Methanobacteriota archaeon]|nr:MAG: transcriptional regulator [Euryarchaeota archaeon]